MVQRVDRQLSRAFAGPGGATAVDTGLERGGVNQLEPLGGQAQPGGGDYLQVRANHHRPAHPLQARQVGQLRLQLGVAPQPAMVAQAALQQGEVLRGVVAPVGERFLDARRQVPGGQEHREHQAEDAQQQGQRFSQRQSCQHSSTSQRGTSPSCRTLFSSCRSPMYWFRRAMLRCSWPSRSHSRLTARSPMSKPSSVTCSAAGVRPRRASRCGSVLAR